METDFRKVAEQHASTFWGESGVEENGYWWFFGETTVCVVDVIEITKSEYEIFTTVKSGRSKLGNALDVLIEARSLFEEWMPEDETSAAEFQAIIEKINVLETSLPKYTEIDFGEDE